MMMIMMCIVDSCSEEGSQLKLTEVAQAPLIKQNLDTNVSVLICVFIICPIAIAYSMDR